MAVLSLILVLVSKVWVRAHLCGEQTEKHHRQAAGMVVLPVEGNLAEQAMGMRSCSFPSTPAQINPVRDAGINVHSLEKGIGFPPIPLMQVWLPVPAHKGSPMEPFQQVSTKKTIHFRENSVGFLQKSFRDRDRVEDVGKELRES